MKPFPYPEPDTGTAFLRVIALQAYFCKDLTHAP